MTQPNKTKVIQIAVTSDGHGQTLFALCDDGKINRLEINYGALSMGEWETIPEIPQ